MEFSDAFCLKCPKTAVEMLMNPRRRIESSEVMQMIYDYIMKDESYAAKAPKYVADRARWSKDQVGYSSAGHAIQMLESGWYVLELDDIKVLVGFEVSVDHFAGLNVSSPSSVDCVYGPDRMFVYGFKVDQFIAAIYNWFWKDSLRCLEANGDEWKLTPIKNVPNAPLLVGKKAVKKIESDMSTFFGEKDWYKSKKLSHTRSVILVGGENSAKYETVQHVCNKLGKTLYHCSVADLQTIGGLMEQVAPNSVVYFDRLEILLDFKNKGEQEMWDTHMGFKEFVSALTAKLNDVYFVFDARTDYGIEEESKNLLQVTKVFNMDKLGKIDVVGLTELLWEEKIDDEKFIKTVEKFPPLITQTYMLEHRTKRKKPPSDNLPEMQAFVMEKKPKARPNGSHRLMM